MSEIIWDSQSLENIVALLRRAASELDDQCAALRSIRAEMGETFKNNAGASRRIMERTDAVIQKTSRLEERSDVLSDSVERASEMIAAAERSIAGLVDGAGEKTISAIPYGGWERFATLIGHVTFTTTPPSVSGITPAWLEEAAEQALSQG
ncbi:MAG: hypothetical protein LUC89_10695 [Oscillospiraceae bacterium]|nr:hypothetical protein [Oscillospiraceae bacterium]